MHVELPCFCKPLARVLRSGFTLGYVIRDATWPTPCYAIAEGLAQLQSDGKVALSSEDGVAQVVLHGHQRRFAVCYPLLVAERPQDAKYDYVWQTQVFSVASYPPRWGPAVRAALQVTALLRQSVQQPCLATSGESPGPCCSPSAMAERNAGSRAADPDPDPDAAGSGGSGAASHDPVSFATPSERRSTLPRADDCVRSAPTELRVEGWWSEPSLSLLPPDDVVSFEWTPQATYQYLPEAGEMEVWVHADESCLVSARGGRFLEHFKGADGGAHKVYAANCVPDAVWSRDQACRYPLASLAAHALKIRSHNTTLRAALAARMPVASALQDGAAGLPRPSCPGNGPGSIGTLGDDLFAVASTAVLEESSVPGHGQFTAYEDGRVRVCFHDRTILHMCVAQSHCKLVLPDGKAVVVAVANPVGVEPYVEAAWEFACWAFKTPEERAQELRLQARVRAELLNSERMAQICEHSATGALPPSLTASPARLLGLTQAGPHADACPPAPEAVTDRQAMIEKLLSNNARLLQRL
ncbi:hypothetical protein PLESTB_000441400 [Pleodorina starrii]|uniref:C5orf34-like C-terminal domain-containing protein n=1 Tax=Pleodorina starrii TaxID=330485 RepID=A0A9W6BFZ1_9CHLO|nr:hypothetical protein PLESTB_000441400 [Pleodorina starrii]GLC73932.1 hypothetical protein PLESTF_001439000 [Pleodorina starrii]